jgi:hypothetical protein
MAHSRRLAGAPWQVGSWGLTGSPHLPACRHPLPSGDTINRAGVAEHTFCKFCGIHSYGVPRVRPDRITVNARCLDNVERAVLTPSRFFDGQNWEEAAKRYLATEQGHAQ